MAVNKRFNVVGVPWPTGSCAGEPAPPLPAGPDDSAPGGLDAPGPLGAIKSRLPVSMAESELAPGCCGGDGDMSQSAGRANPAGGCAAKARGDGVGG